MPDARPQPTAAPEHRRDLIVWLAMLWAIVLYYVGMQFVPPVTVWQNPMLPIALLAVAFAMVALSFVMKNRLTAQAREAGKPGLRQTGQLLALVFCDAAALLGIVAWFVTGSRQSHYPLIVGFVGVLLHYPTREIPS